MVARPPQDRFATWLLVFRTLWVTDTVNFVASLAHLAMRHNSRNALVSKFRSNKFVMMRYKLRRKGSAQEAPDVRDRDGVRDGVVPARRPDSPSRRIAFAARRSRVAAGQPLGEYCRMSQICKEPGAATFY